MLKYSFTHTKLRRWKGVDGQRQSLADLARGGDTTPILRMAGWAMGSVWTGAENIAHIGILIRGLYPSPDIFRVIRSRRMK
jgi:hypothetical protein